MGKNLVTGTKVIINQKCKLPHLRGSHGVLVDMPNKHGNWGVFLRGKRGLPDCELWFSEDEFDAE